jgi:hypothetical protein
MEVWVMMIVGVLGLGFVFAILAWLWYMIIYGLVHVVREKRGEQGPGQPRLDQVEDSVLPHTEPKGA